MPWHRCERWRKAGMPCPFQMFNDKRKWHFRPLDLLPLGGFGKADPKRFPQENMMDWVELDYEGNRLPDRVMEEAEKLVTRRASEVTMGGRPLRETIIEGGRVAAGVAGVAAVGAGVFQLYRSGGFGGHLFPSMCNPHKPTRRYKLSESGQAGAPVGGPQHI